MDFPTLATLFSGISFLFFGASCWLSPYMVTEFQRYGYGKQRKLTGTLQFLAGLALTGSFWAAPWLVTAAAIGLFLMMSVGVFVRHQIGDSFLQTTPALFYALLNLYLSIYHGSRL